MAFALATSAAQPVQRFDTAAELARAILGRPGPHDTHTLARGAFWPPGESHEAIAVYGHAHGSAFIGYAIGFGHDRDALAAALADAKRNGGILTMGTRPYSHPPKPEEIIGDLDAVADTLKQLDFTLDRVYRAADERVCERLDEILSDYDFKARSEKLRQYADEWQRNIDAPVILPAPILVPANG